MRSRTRPASTASGFTLVEISVVIAIVAILAALTIVSFSRARPRADMKTAAAELQALFHQAREAALATGTPVSVLVFKNFTPPRSGQGFFIVYQDACFDFFTGGGTCGVTYGTYNPAVLRTGSSGSIQSAVLDTMTLPVNIMIGPATGMGATAVLTGPLSGVVVNVDCSFCGSTGGAVQFDARGQATFFSLAGSTVNPVPVSGGASLSLGYISTVTAVTGQMTLVIFSASGAVQVLGTG